jgi:hypothetical protein
LSRDDDAENQARLVNGQICKVKEAHERWKLVRKWLVESATRRAGRTQGGSVTRSLGINLTASKDRSPKSFGGRDCRMDSSF